MLLTKSGQSHESPQFVLLTSVDEIATESVFIPDDQVKREEKEACIKYDAELTTKVLKEEDNQSAVVPDIFFL